MAEQARQTRGEEQLDPASGSSRARARDTDAGSDGIDKVLRFALPEKREEPAIRTASLTARDFATAVDIVHGAAEAIRAAESRSRDAEARTHLLVQRATEELKNAETRVQAAEVRAQAAEARAQEAEARTKEAEGWLRQIFSTITEELPVHGSGKV